MSDLKRSATPWSSQLTQVDQWDSYNLNLLWRQLLREVGSHTRQGYQALDRLGVGGGRAAACNRTGWGAHTHWEAAGKGCPLPKRTNTVDKKSRGKKKKNKAVTLASGQSARVREQIPIQNRFNWDYLLIYLKASWCQHITYFPLVLKIKVSKLP